MLKEYPNAHQPIVVGGLGGSGTRTVAELMHNFGIQMGTLLNPALDNLWFSFLFNRPSWKLDFPDAQSQLSAVKLLEKATIIGLMNNATSAELRTIESIAHEFEETSKTMGVNTAQDFANSLKHSKGFTANSPVYWAWKEPNTHLFLPALLSYYPKLKYIHMVRHGLDMAYSKNQQQRREWKNSLHLFKPYAVEGTHSQNASINSFSSPHNVDEEIWHSLDYWIAANRRAIEIGHAMPSNNFLLINYEKLCDNPIEVTTKIAQFLEIDKHTIDIPASAQNIKPASTIGRYKDYPPLDLPITYTKAIEQIGYSI